MAQHEVVVLGHQHQFVLLDIGGDRLIGRLAAKHAADVVGEVTALDEPVARF